MANNIAVSISVDTADLVAKRAVLSAELRAANKDLNDFAKQAATSGMTDELRAGLLAAATSAEQFRAGIDQINTKLKETRAVASPAAESLEHGFAGASISIREMGVQLRESLGFIGEMREAALAFGEALIAAFAVERIFEWGKEVGEAAEKTQHLAETFGLTVAQVQQLQGVAALTGVPIEALTKGMRILDRNAVQAAGSTSAAANAFKAVGISANDGRTQMERMFVVADRFKDMEDGPKKVALAMELFGKSGAELIPVLNLGSEGLAKLTGKMQEYGVGLQAANSISATSQAAGLALAESMNENRIAFMGLSQVMVAEFAPATKAAVDEVNSLIKAFIESYQHGGTAKTVLHDIGIVAKGTAIFLFDLGAVTVAVFEGINAAAAAIAAPIAAVIDAIIAGVKLVIVAFEDMAKTMQDAFRLDWNAVIADFQNGFSRLGKTAYVGGRTVASDFQQGYRSIADSISTAEAAIGAADAFATAMDGKGRKGGVETTRGGAATFDPQLGASKKAKKPKDDLVQRLDAELTAKKEAWAKEQVAHGTAIAFSLQAEADYWGEILKRTDLTTQQRAEIEKKHTAVLGQITKERIAIAIDGYKRELAEADKNAAAKLEIANRELAYITKTFGTESKEYGQAQAEIVRIKKEAAQQLRDLDDIRDKAIDKANLDHIAAEEAAAKNRVALGLETNASLLDELRSFEDSRYAIELAAAKRDRAAVDPAKDPVKASALDVLIEQIERDHQTKMTALDQQGALDRAKIARQSFTPFADSLAQMLTLQRGVMSTLKSLWTDLGNLIGQVITRWTENFLVALATQDAAAELSHLKQVAHLAKQAAANAYNAVVGIPIIGPILAPPAAAVAFAGVMAFSAEGGMDRVPYDGATIIAHKDEMMLSAQYANPLRDMLTGSGRWSLPSYATNAGWLGAAGGSSPSGLRGDTHHHEHFETTIHVHAVDAKSVDALITEREGTIAKTVVSAHRNGRFLNTPLQRSG